MTTTTTTTAASSDPVAVALSRAADLHHRINSTLSPPNKISDSCKTTLLRLVAAELRFLSRRSISATTSSLSTNLGYFESIFGILQHPSVAKVSRVCKPVASSPTVHVDVVCTVGRRVAWLLVSDRNPKHVSWFGSGRNKGVRARVEQVLGAVRGSGSLRPECVLMFFCSGVGDDVGRRLVEEFGAVELVAELLGGPGDGGLEELEDGWVNVVWNKAQAQARVFEVKIEGQDVRCGSVRGVDREGDGLQAGLVTKKDGVYLPDDDMFRSVVSGLRTSSGISDEMGYSVLNFDTTALVALVSGISNGGAKKLIDAPEDDTRKRFKGNFEFVMAQVASELENPIIMELKDVIIGKKGIICESVQLEFMDLVSMCGGPREKYRANHLLKNLRVVKDCPSPRMMALPTTRKITMKNKIVFGTGDYWRAATLTANIGFVRAISQTGMTLLTIEHKPRALTGQ